MYLSILVITDWTFFEDAFPVLFHLFFFEQKEVSLSLSLAVLKWSWQKMSEWKLYTIDTFFAIMVNCHYLSILRSLQSEKLFEWLEWKLSFVALIPSLFIQYVCVHIYKLLILMNLFWKSISLKIKIAMQLLQWNGNFVMIPYYVMQHAPNMAVEQKSK